MSELDIQAGRIAESLARVSGAITRSPKSAPHYLLRANLHFVAGKFQEATEDIDRALALGMKDTNEPISMLAAIYENSADPQGVLQQLEQARPAYEGNPDRLALIGRMYLATGNAEKAREVYEEALAKGSQLTLVHNDLAYLLAKAGQDLDRAAELARLATEAPGEQLAANDTLGFVHLVAGNYEAAAWQFRAVTERAEPPVPSTSITTAWH